MLLAYEENINCEVHLISLAGILATELWLKAMMLTCISNSFYQITKYDCSLYTV
jgi:hypothetical protein